MCLTTIANNQIRANIKSLGAELVSLKTADEHEYLWQGDPSYWTGQSPLLFPVIGGLPDDSYEWEGKRWSLGSHGFARKMEFQTEVTGPESVQHSLSANETTLRSYPFQFRLNVIHTVRENTLDIAYEVENQDERVMPFSIGGHPGFNCPLEAHREYQDYRLRFSCRETASRYFKVGKLLSGEKEVCLQDSDVLPLTHGLFDRGAVIFKNLISDEVTLECDEAGRGVTMHFPDFTHFGVWKAPQTEAPYVCLEPWFGVDSTEGGPRQLDGKEGVILLDPGGSFSCRYSIRLHR